jgi:RNA polymerase sigma factor (sigma-70 family)
MPPDERPESDMSDEEVAARCAANRQDGDAWSELKRRFQKVVQWKVLGMIAPAGCCEVDDYVADVWVRLLEQIHRFDRERGKFRAFLMALTHNLVIDVLRARHHEMKQIRVSWQELQTEPQICEYASAALQDLLETVVTQVDRSLQDPRKRLIFGELQAGTRVSAIARTHGLNESFVRRTRDELERLFMEVLEDILPPKNK